MIKVICTGHNYEYEVRELLKIFFKPNEITIMFVDYEIYNNLGNQSISEDILITSRLTIADDNIVATSALNGKEVIETGLIGSNSLETSKLIKILVKRSLFKLIRKITDIRAPWGILTGIRPTKIVHELLNKDLSEEKILLILVNEYCINDNKAKLLLDIAKVGHKFVYPFDQTKISLYISIPFCPTRCLYCSFPSNPLGQSAHLVEGYVNALCKEIEETAKLIKKSNKRVQAIYIGGGTPTTLSVLQFTRIFNTIKSNINLDTLEELTVEAGRPDTINYEKLMFFQKENVTRISINPQTMNDSTLKNMGREHTVKELVESYEMATKTGFKNINMDIIIGLPGEDTNSVQHTMEMIKKLSPANLTVHTLAVKRASKLRETEGDYSLAQQQEIMDMLEITQSYAKDMGLIPYYMYRQKHMLGNLENVGYARPGYECIYNIQIIEEKQTIIALGAGAVSKFTFPKENRLERVPNVKNLEHYMGRIDEMVSRKAKFM